jgi:hypothetical protein
MLLPLMLGAWCLCRFTGRNADALCLLPRPLPVAEP